MRNSSQARINTVTLISNPGPAFQPMIHEQITLTVPRGTRAWINKLKKAGITPEQVFRIGIAKVGEQIAEHAAKNSETQSTPEKGETHEVSNQAGVEAGPSQEHEGERGDA